MIVVFDTNVIVEGIFWPRSTARRALAGLAHRRFKSAVSLEILDEYKALVAEIRQRMFPRTQPAATLASSVSKSIHVDPMPLPEKLNRDAHDNVFVATAAAARAAYPVTQDRDLLALEKTFGIQIVTPVQLIRHVGP
ncbi:MAG: putative toxin-antitoxin system toxin component, PIN family [Verrucomicrobiales bacterium]|nr:putative toxin-antitoxin system toxin component, PIN family [Verrucomicrobiales bacterium]